MFIIETFGNTIYIKKKKRERGKAYKLRGMLAVW